MSMQISDFIECSSRSQTLPELFGLLMVAAEKEGFDRVAYGALTYHEPLHLPDHSPPAIASNYPSAWRTRYFEREYYRLDPVVLLAPCMSRPFSWEWLKQRRDLPARQRLIFEEASEAGLRSGVSVPLHGPGGRVAVASFASGAERVCTTAAASRLNALASQFHIAFSEISRAAPSTADVVELSQRERDCLAWAAQGKSSWDIGMILNISENTVNFHIKNVMRKLETTSRTVAIIKAIHLNLFSLPYISGVFGSAGTVAEAGARRQDSITASECRQR